MRTYRSRRKVHPLPCVQPEQNANQGREQQGAQFCISDEVKKELQKAIKVELNLTKFSGSTHASSKKKKASNAGSISTISTNHSNHATSVEDI